MPNYGRAWIPGGTYFFTINLLERERMLLVEHMGELRRAFRDARTARPSGRCDASGSPRG